MREIKINWKEKDEIIQIKELSWGDMEDVTNLATKIRTIAGTPEVNFDNKIYNLNLMIKSITKAPFVVNSENLRQLTNRDGKRILKEITELNALTEDEKKE
jgi:phage FluMu protein gp41